MDRSTKTGFTSPRLALAVTTALAGLALTGCATASAPQGQVSFASAQTALQKGQTDKAIAHAEAAVLAEPRNPGFRALLGATYLEAGRFQSAATSFTDALELGNEDPRTVLSLSLTRTALGRGRAAVQVLDDYARIIDPADLGLAYALAGQPERGIHVMINAVRNSEEATPKLRQNLAYTYALAGNWRAARVMAAEDVPADQLDARMTEWALMSAPEQYQQRVAAMLSVTPSEDAGQPKHLALANFPATEVMVAEAATQADAPVQAAAVPTPAAVETAPRPSVAEAFAPAAASPVPAAPAAAPVASAASSRTITYVSNPVVQPLPAASTAAAPRMAKSSQRRMATAPAAPMANDKAADTHLVQLGSYDSKGEAERGWAVLQSQFPELKGHDAVITEALVNGRTFWRVAAAGFGPVSAKGMCAAVKSAGRGCFAYAATNPPKGAVSSGAKMAARSR